MANKQSEILGDVSDLLTLLNFLNVKDTSMKNSRSSPESLRLNNTWWKGGCGTSKTDQSRDEHPLILSYHLRFTPIPHV